MLILINYLTNDLFFSSFEYLKYYHQYHSCFEIFDIQWETFNMQLFSTKKMVKIIWMYQIKEQWIEKL